jgi:hypothetical protein
MSPLIATRFVAPEGMVVPCGQAVEIGTVAAVVGSSVAGGAVVATVVGDAVVGGGEVVGLVVAVVTATVVDVDATDEAALWSDDLDVSSQPAMTKATPIVQVTAHARGAFIRSPLGNCRSPPEILAGRQVHSRDDRRRS